MGWGDPRWTGSPGPRAPLLERLFQKRVTLLSHPHVHTSTHSHLVLPRDPNQQSFSLPPTEPGEKEGQDVGARRPRWLPNSSLFSSPSHPGGGARSARAASLRGADTGRPRSGERVSGKRAGCGQGRARHLGAGRKELKIRDWLCCHRFWEGKRPGGRVRSLARVLPSSPRAAGDLGRPDAASGSLAGAALPHSRRSLPFPSLAPSPTFSPEREQALSLSPS